MARRTCILCERELLPFGKCTIDLHGTRQSLCSGCKRTYEKSALEEKFVLWDKMLRSSALEDYETVRAGVARARENWENKQNKERGEQELTQRRREYMERAACCCDKPMTYLGARYFSPGGWDGLLQWDQSVDMFRCECCGQIKFFQLPNLQAKDETTTP